MWNPTIELRGVFTRRAAVEEADLLAYLAERTAAAHRAMGLLVGSRDLLVENGIAEAIVSGGGTGPYAITGAYEGLTALQAGSYATMDAKYRSVGLDFAQALTVVARVISARDDTAIIDAGMKTLTHEFGMPEVVQPTGWRLKGLSEEHGSLIREGGEPLKPGDRVEIVPSHGCTTINLHDVYHVTRGARYEGLWPIAARGAIR